METPRPYRRVNFKLIAIIVIALAVLITGGAFALKHRRKSMIIDALRNGRALLAEGEFDEARKEFKYYLSKRNDDLDARIEYAVACLRTTPPQLSNAANAYRYVLQERPEDREVARRLATLYFRARDFDNTAYICRQRLNIDPTDTAATVLLAEALISQDSSDEATQLLTSLIERRPDVPEAYVLLSSLAMRRDSDEARKLARQWLDQGVAANPNSAKSLAYRARFRRSVLRDVDGAREDLNAADQFPTDDPWTMLLMTEQWVDLGDLVRAQRELDRVDAVSPDALFDHEQYLLAFEMARFVTEANLVVQQGDAKRAVALAKAVRDRLPDDQLSVVLPLVTRLYITADRLDHADKLLAEFESGRQNVERDYQLAKRNLALSAAMIDTQREQWHRVINRLEPIVESGEIDEKRVWSRLGRAYDETDQTGRAVDAWDRAFALGATDVDTAQRLVKACLTRDLIKAYRIATRARLWSRDSIDAKLLQTEVLVSAAVFGWVSPDLIGNIKSDLATWAEQFPLNGKIRILSAALASIENRDDDVIELLNTVLARCDKKREAVNSMVTFFVTRNRLDDAVTACRKAAELAGEIADPYVFLARLLAGRGDFEQAQQVLESAAERLEGVERFDVQTALADLLIRHQRLDEAIDLLTRLTVQNPGDVHIRAELLKIPQVQQNEMLSSRLLEELREIEGPRGLRWRFAESLLRLASDNWRDYADKIESMLQYCIRADGAWAEPVLALGAFYERADRLDDAQQVYQFHFDQHPNHVDVAGKLLEVLEKRRRFADADAVLQRVPRDIADMSGHRVNIAIGRGKYNDAIAELERRRESNPKDAVARLILAELMYQVNRDAASAFALLDEAQLVNPEMRSVVSARLDLLRSEGRIDEATRIANDQVSRFDDFAAYLMRARHFDAIGEVDRAEADYRRLLEFEDQSAAAYLALGEFYNNHNRVDEAIKTWRKGLALAADDAGITHRLTEALLSREDAQLRFEGEQLLADGLAKYPDDTVLLKIKATDLLKKRTQSARAEAISILQKIVQADPRDVTAYLKLVQLTSQSGQRDGALSLVNEGLGANPGSEPLLLARAGLEKEQGNLRAAQSLASSILEFNHDSVPARVLLADVAIAQDDRATAERLVRQALDIDPASEPANLVYVSLLYGADRLDEAIAHLESFCETPAGRTSANVLTRLADLYVDRGDYSSAKAQLDRIAPGDADLPGVFRTRLRMLAETRRYDELIDAVNERTDDQITPPALITFAGQLLLRADQPELLDAAMSFFDRVIESRAHPIDERDAELAKAQAAYRLNDLALCEKSYKRVLALDPYHSQALNNLSWILSEKLDKPHEALELADRGLARHPDDAFLLDTRGIVLYRMESLDRARADLERCLALTDDDAALHARALIHLAQVLIEQGDSQSAIDRINEALRIDKQNTVLDDDLRDKAHDILANIR